VPDDGVTVDVPLSLFARVDLDAFAWSVPGLREEVLTELIRSLPKAIRRSFAPAPTHAAAVLAAIDGGGQGRLLEILAQRLSALGGTSVAPGDFDASQLPPHLRVRLRVVEADGSAVAAGRDLTALRRELVARQRAAVAELASGYTRSGLTRWSVGELPRTIEVAGPAGNVLAYPALVAEPGGTAGVQVFATPDEADAATPGGVLALVLAGIASPIKSLVANLSTTEKLAIAAPVHQDTASLLSDVVRAAADDLARRWASSNGWPRTADGFAELQGSVAASLKDVTREVLGLVVRVTGAAGEAYAELAAAERRVPADRRTPALSDGLGDARRHLDAIVGRGYVVVAGRERLPHLLRYLAASRRRLATIAEDPARDADLLARWRGAAADVARARAAAAARPGGLADPALITLTWQLEEFRVALFAQAVGTAHPVSEQRIRKAADALTGRS
jgi:ATP-dependent helicase HrpA